MATAVTRLSDAIVPDVFSAYMLKETTVKAHIFQSGALTPDADLAAKLAGGGRLFQAPFWNDLDDTESDVGNDDPTDEADTGKIGSAKLQAIRQLRTRGWSSARLVKYMAGDDPQTRIAARAGEYWARQFNTITVNTLRGIFADNAANDSSDMIYDISGNSGDAAKISASAILETKQTMGDEAEALSLLIMHSRLYTNLQKQNLIAFIPNSRGEVNIPTYLGYRVLVSDTVPVIDAGGGDFHYHTYLLGMGVLGWAEVGYDPQVEVKSNPAGGRGAGVQELWMRRQFCLHPYGFHFTDSSTVGEFPTNTELRTAANWDRRYSERKMYKLALLVTKNG